MKKYIKMTSANPPEQVGDFFLAENDHQAQKIAFPYVIKCVGDATLEDVNQLTIRSGLEYPYGEGNIILDNKPALNYLTWQNLIDVPPPERQPIWLKTSVEDKWSYKCFTFYNLEDCKVFPHSLWMPIIGHDYGDYESIIHIDPIDECSLPYTTEISLDKTNLFKVIEKHKGEVEYVGNKPFHGSIWMTGPDSPIYHDLMKIFITNLVEGRIHQLGFTSGDINIIKDGQGNFTVNAHIIHEARMIPVNIKVNFGGD